MFLSLLLLPYKCSWIQAAVLKIALTQLWYLSLSAIGVWIFWQTVGLKSESTEEMAELVWTWTLVLTLLFLTVCGKWISPMLTFSILFCSQLLSEVAHLLSNKRTLFSRICLFNSRIWNWMNSRPELVQKRNFRGNDSNLVLKYLKAPI